MAVLVAVFALAVAGCSAGDDAVSSPGDTTPEPTMPGDETTPPDETASPEMTPTPEETVPDEPTDPPESTPDPEPTDAPPTRTPSERITPTPPPDSPPRVTGEVPADYLDDVVTDAAQRAGVPAEDIVVLRSESVQWSDGSLGCPEPGHMYTQALVDGYWVELEADSTVYDYRLNDRGAFRLCTSPTLKPPIPRERS